MVRIFPALLRFGCCACLTLAACQRPKDGPNRSRHIAAPKITPQPRAPEPEVPTPPPARPRWILFGGGTDPVSTPISLSQDLAALTRVLPDTGVVLFGGGRGAPMAVERPPDEQPDDVRTVLADLFAPPGYSQLDYLPADFTIHGAATRERVLSTLRMALWDGREDDLLLYFAGHGEQGESPDDNRMLLWGGTDLRAYELASLLDEKPGPRRVRLVSTACFSGGFSELIFEGGEAPALGPGSTRCGLFAAPWDDEASGCDPNPDRRAHESYAVHLIGALEDPGRAKDLDGDGAIGLLDAHTFARHQAQSIDVPTTTSERFLRLHAPADTGARADTAAARALLPEEAHLADSLGSALSLPDETAAFERVAALEAQMTRADEELRLAEQEADGAYFDLRIALLERWPLLAHPYRSGYHALLEAEGETILRQARDSELALRYARIRAALGPLAERYDKLRVLRARALRVARAHETLRLAQALIDRKDPHLPQLRALRACERAPL